MSIDAARNVVGQEVREVSSVLTERFHGKLIGRHIKEFGILFLVIFLFAAYSLFKKGYSLPYPALCVVAGVGFGIGGFLFPLILYPLWKRWMDLAKVLSMVVTPVVLFVVWIALVVPVSLIARMVAVKTMDTTFRTGAPSYWVEREEKKHNFKLLERQF